MDPLSDLRSRAASHRSTRASHRMAKSKEKVASGKGFPHVLLLYLLVSGLCASELLGFYWMHHRLQEGCLSTGESDHLLIRQRASYPESDSWQSNMPLPRHWDNGESPLDESPQGPPAKRIRRTAEVKSLATTNVEFVHPRMRDDLDREDAEEGVTAGEGEEDPWVWLTSYARIPLQAIEEFCSATRDYCPPGPAGPQGNPGTPGRDGRKGERGDRGLPGEMGARGPTGPAGIPGPRGPKGVPGLPGLDGRDGLPGEPGLDGMPGRNGLDGVDGMDGVPGTNGTPGTPGRNGSDGRPGDRGPTGPAGPSGPRGFPGIRGQTGSPGIPGIPGLNAWMINKTEVMELLIPPSIPEFERTSSNPIVVHEGENLRLRCASAGAPVPVVVWRKEDGAPIPIKSWQSSSEMGFTLNLTRVNREHMGGYVCHASNGVYPDASKKFHVEVHFPPLILIQNQMVGAANGTNAILDCYVEAFPEAVTYWERSDGRLIENGTKYIVTHKLHSRYKMNITRLSGADYGRYHCIAKNEIGITKGAFTLIEIDPALATPPPVHISGKGGVAIYGQVPPDRMDLEDLCPPQTPCPECPPPAETRCREGSLSLSDLVDRLEIANLDGFDHIKDFDRKQKCLLTAVGKPVYHRYTDDIFGCWMRDPLPRHFHDGEKMWVTRHNDTLHLLEYANKTLFRRDIHSENYSLPISFKGNFHAVYDGAFYYTQAHSPIIVRYDLTTQHSMSKRLPGASDGNIDLLYNSEVSTVDLAVDENGLWAIYALSGTNNTAVVKFNASSLDIVRAYNINVDHRKVGDMFIMCGVLYAVDSVSDRNTKIRFALDLYQKKLIDVDLSFSNPFRRTTMVTYNPRTKELFTWDKGNQLTYPIKYLNVTDNLLEEDDSRRK